MAESSEGHPLEEDFPTRLPIMELEVYRFSSGPEDTLGALFDVTDGGRRFLCFTIEDEHRTKKVYAETRIPAGRYELTLRTAGGFHQRYAKKFPELHKGMIYVNDVPGFQWILWHIGNDDDDTAGCLLLGDEAVQNRTGPGRIRRSTDAYRRVYPIVRDALLAGPVFATYVDAG